MTTRSVDTVIREAGDSIRQALHALADQVAGNGPEYLSSQEVADLLHWDVQTVQRKARAGELPYKRVGKRYLFPADEIRKLG